MIVGKRVIFTRILSKVSDDYTGAKGGGLGYTKGIPAGAPPEAEFIIINPHIILTEKVFHLVPPLHRFSDSHGQVEFIVQLLQPVALGCIKLSFIMFYRRVFCTGKQTWFSISTAIMGGLIVAWTITFFFVFLFYCGNHQDKEWSTVTDLLAYCPHALDDDKAIGISDSIMDIIIIALPIPVVSRPVYFSLLFYWYRY